MKNINELRKFDGLQEAENITGKSYKEDDSVVWLGMALSMQNNQEKEKYYNAVDDTLFSNTVKDYLRKTATAGFELIYQEDFVYTPDYGEMKPQNESLYVLFNYQYGILIYFDTFFGNVNGSKMCYNWSPNSAHYSNATSSGSFLHDDKTLVFFEEDMETRFVIKDLPEVPKWDCSTQTWEQYRAISDPVDELRNQKINEVLASGKRILWAGDHDGREGIKSIINELLEQGKFFPYWHTCAFSWITSFADHKGNHNFPYTDFQEKTKDILNKIPKLARKQIGNYKS